MSLRATTPPDAHWLGIRVQQMLHCRHTLVELVEEVQEAGGDAARRLTEAWLAAYTGAGQHERTRGEEEIMQILADQAVARATGEWRRLQQEAA